MSVPVFHRRTNVVVPARLVAGLDLPALAVTTGEPGVEWVDVPVGDWQFRRRPTQRLPLDPKGARRARRYLRWAPWGPLAFLVWLVLFDSVLLGVSVLVAVIAWAVLVLAGSRWGTGAVPGQAPRFDPSGDLRIPGVPVDVAEQWVLRNPGVAATDEPAPRERFRGFYAKLSAFQIGTALVLGATLWSNGKGDTLLLWAAAALLFTVGCLAVLRTLPLSRPRF